MVDDALTGNNTNFPFRAPFVSFVPSWGTEHRPKVDQRCLDTPLMLPARFHTPP